MKIYGNKCLFFVLYSFNTLLLVAGASIITIGIYESCIADFKSWYDICFGVYGLILFGAAIFGFISRSNIGQFSLYLSLVSICASFHISFSVGIIYNNSPGMIHLEDKRIILTYLLFIGVAIGISFILACIYRSSLQRHIKPNGRSLTLEEDYDYNIN